MHRTYIEYSLEHQDVALGKYSSLWVGVARTILTNSWVRAKSPSIELDSKNH